MPNPLPPPPPRRRGDATGVRSANLSNSDFRQMVMDTPRRVPPPETPRDSKKKKDEDKRARSKKYRPKPKEEETKKQDEVELPKYRDRAKERREDQNPDYEDLSAAIGSFHAVAPPGTSALAAADTKTLTIEKSKYLGGDIEHTHLVKGLDYALLNKQRIKMETENVQEDPEPEEKKEEAPSKPWSEDDPVTFHSPLAKVVHRYLVKPPAPPKINEMFLPGRMAFVFDMENSVEHIPTNLHRSKVDCPSPEDYVTGGVDAPVLERIANIIQYLKLGSSGKGLRKKKKEKLEAGGRALLNENELKVGPLVEQVQPQNEVPEDDIFQDVGTEYVPTGNDGGSPHSEDMVESPRDDDLGPEQGPTMPPAVQWEEYPGVPPSQETYIGPCHQDLPYRDLEEDVLKRDEKQLHRPRELDAREKDPNFVSESYSECYPSYQEYNREIADSDDEGDLTKMDMGGKGKGRLHRRNFDTEEEWAKYNDQKEAMPKAAFQFGVKTQDGRKTRKHREQKLSNELNKINQIIEKKKKGSHDRSDDTPAEEPRPKRLRT